jgi:hypothetical protein
MIAYDGIIVLSGPLRSVEQAYLPAHPMATPSI